VCIKVGSKKISYTMMHGRKNIKGMSYCVKTDWVIRRISVRRSEEENLK